MDASKEQKTGNQGLNARERAALEEKKKEKKIRVKYSIIAAIIVIFVAVVILVNSSVFTNKLTALKVNDTSYSIADGNYSYQDGYMSFCNQYSSLLSYILDTSTPLNEQECTWDEECATWHDYFKKNAEDNLVQMTAIYDAAVKAGYTITEDDQSEVDETISSLSIYASAYGYTLDGYIAATYGAGNNEKTVRANMEKSAVVQRYLSDLYDSFTYTDEDKDTYYADNYNDLTTVSFLYTYISATADEENGITEEDALTAANEQAEAIVSGMEKTTADEFSAAVLEITGSDANENSYTISSFLSAYEGSVEEADIKADTCFVHATDSGVYVVFVTGIEDNSYNTVSVRHILVKAVDEDGDGTYSDAEKQAAYDAIVEIQKEWEAGAKTEDSFATLATLKSEDTGSTENGGLYEGIYKGQMVPEFDAFCFEDHQPGDVAIVFGDTATANGSDGYMGYHLVYFVSADGELYSRTLAESNLRSEDYSAAAEALVEGYSATETGLWHYVMK